MPRREAREYKPEILQLFDEIVHGDTRRLARGAER